MTDERSPYTGEERDPLTTDLCDQWIDRSGRRCDAYWREEIKLAEAVHVTPSTKGGSVWGTYGPGAWRFCRVHARIFNRDRDDRKEQAS